MRSTDADFNRFPHVAMGSASELEYLLLLSRDLELMSASLHERIATDLHEVKRMLAALIARFRADS